MKVRYFDGMVTFKSDNTLSKIAEVLKKNKKAAELYDENDNLLYSVSISKNGRGGINENGVLYSAEPSVDGYAKLTVELPDSDNAVEYIADNYGQFILYMETIDDQIKAAADDISVTMARVRSMINVVD